MKTISSYLIPMLCIGYTLNGAINFTGNGTSTTFNFGVGNVTPIYNFDFKTGSIYVASTQVVPGNTYAITKADFSDLKFVPLAPLKVRFNGQSDAVNPLNGAKIDFLTMNGQMPVVVKDGETRLIAFTNPLGTSLIASAHLNDATTAPTTQILALEALSMQTKFIAPVLNNAGAVFGTAGSGVALLDLSLGNNKATFNVLNADPLDVATASNKAAPLDNSSAAFKITSDVVIANNEVDAFYISPLASFYISVQLISGAGAGSGARAVLVGYELNGKLYFNKIAPDAAFVGDNQIVGTGDSSSAVSILKVRYLKTSTGLDYIVVIGGNGAKDSVQNQLYALPVVNSKGGSVDRNIIGTLAKYDQEPTNYYNQSVFFTGRAFTQPATTAADLLTNTQEQAQIGGGPLPILPTDAITDIFVFSDTVYVSTAANLVTLEHPGIFKSQAMFAANGVIKSWTPWQRVAATEDPTFAIAIDIFKGNFIYLNGASSVTANNLFMTAWGTGTAGLSGGDNGLVATADGLYPHSIRGIQGLLDFPRTTTGFSDFSMMIATGLNQISLIESGKMQAGLFSFSRGDFADNSVSFTNGQIGTIPVGTKIVTTNYGSLLLGPIITAAIASNVATTHNWLFAGGVKGLSLLTTASGYTWAGTISTLSDLPAASFKQLGNFKFVKKLVADDEFLYVLTNTQLIRIVLNASDFISGNLQTTVIADGLTMSTNDQTYFEDFVISGPLALLATSNGLYRTGNAKNIQTITSPSDAQWTLVTTPGAAGPAFRIYPFSTTENLADFAVNGMVYILSAYIGYNNATVSRFSVALQAGIVTDSTIQWVQDILIKNVPSSFIDFSAFRNSYSRIGANNYNTVSTDVDRVNRVNELLPPLFQILKPSITDPAILTFYQAVDLNLALPDNASIVSSAISTRSASGGLMVSGDFGLRVNE